MKKSIFAFALLAIGFGSIFTSCKDDDNNSSSTTTDDVDALVELGVLKGVLDHDVTLDAATTYSLAGTFAVGDSATLTIPAGTRIEATEGFSSYIIVAQGGKININGTAANPVVMTAEDESAASAGYWGGLIINGKAKISGTTDGGVTATCEMNSAYTYGGSDDTDNSGSITYLIMKYAGSRSSADVEHNGLTLDAVGSGTTIDNIYIYANADDGIECFGGTVNISNVLVVNEDDDMFDNTQGYRGTWTNFYGIWESGFVSSEDDPRGIESDGNFDGKTPSDLNQTTFTVKNITFELKLAYDSTAKADGTLMHDVIKIRRGATATITNALVKGTGAVGDLIDLTDKKGCSNDATSVSLTNSLTNGITGSEVATSCTAADGVTTLTTSATGTVAAGNTGCTADFSWTGDSNF